MSDFHSLFRESLDKRKLTIYRLSKELQIDRSTLYQVQNGGRLPTAQVFRRMASYLNLSSREEKQWLEAWKRERLGPNHYYLRRKVEVCVRMLDKYTYERTAADEPFVWEEQITQTVCAEGKSKAAILLKKLLRAYLLSGDLAILDVHLPLPFFSRCCTGIPWMAGKRSGICVRQLLPLKGQEQEDAVPALEALDGVFGIFFFTAGRAGIYALLLLRRGSQRERQPVSLLCCNERRAFSAQHRSGKGDVFAGSPGSSRLPNSV